MAINFDIPIHSSVDIWSADISVDEAGDLWIDFDNQQRLQMAPISDEAFIVEGFIQVYRFQAGEGGAYDRMIMERDGTELVFNRQ